MKLKNFRNLIEQRFSKEEIAEIEQRAELEIKTLRALQEDAKQAQESNLNV
jgi:hypothetical protein